MVDSIRAHERANEPVYAQLHGLTDAMQRQLEQNQAMQSNVETAINRAVAG
jgi:hypothetical protein